MATSVQMYSVFVDPFSVMFAFGAAVVLQHALHLLKRSPSIKNISVYAIFKKI